MIEEGKPNLRTIVIHRAITSLLKIQMPLNGNEVGRELSKETKWKVSQMLKSEGTAWRIIFNMINTCILFAAMIGATVCYRARWGEKMVFNRKWFSIVIVLTITPFSSPSVFKCLCVFKLRYAAFLADYCSAFFPQIHQKLQEICASKDKVDIFCFPIYKVGFTWTI